MISDANTHFSLLKFTHLLWIYRPTQDNSHHQDDITFLGLEIWTWTFSPGSWIRYASQAAKIAK